MAFTLQFYTSTFELVDKGGNVTTRTFRHRQTDTAGDISALLTAESSMAAALIAVTDCAVRKQTLSRVVVEDAFALPSVDTAEVSAHALITAKITGAPNKSASIDIPGPKNTLFVANSGKNYNIVDMADSALVTYLNEFTGATPNFLISDGETITQADAAGKRTHSRSVSG